MMRVPNNRGAAIVEFAIVGMLLFVLVMGIIEVGILITNYMSLNTGVRETVRQVALRTDLTDAELVEQISKSAPTLDQTAVTATQYYREYDESTKTWPEIWSPGRPSDDVPAASIVQVKVAATYKCAQLSKMIFRDPVVLKTEVAMRRE